VSKGIFVCRTIQSRKTCVRNFRAYFAELSSADTSRKHRQRTGPRKKGAGMFLPVHWVPARLIVVTSGVFTNTLMSPVEHSRKHRQLVPKEGCGNVRTGDSCLPCNKLLKRLAIGQYSNVTCGTFAEASSADWSAKEGCGNVLTGDSSLPCTKLLKRLAIGQDSNVTCGIVAEASSADWSAKERCWNGPRK
jgi:hypothetical protein